MERFILLLYMIVFVVTGCTLSAELSSAEKGLLGERFLIDKNAVGSLKSLALPFEAEPQPSLIFKNVAADTDFLVFADSACSQVLGSASSLRVTSGSDWVELKMPAQSVNTSYSYYVQKEDGCELVAEHTYKKVERFLSGRGAVGLHMSDGSYMSYGQNGWGAQSNHLLHELTDVVMSANSAYATAVLKQDGTVLVMGQDNNGEWFDSSVIPPNVKELYGTGNAFLFLTEDKKFYTLEVTGLESPFGTSGEFEKVFLAENQYCLLKTDKSVRCSHDDPAPGDNSNIKEVVLNGSWPFAAAALKEDGTVIAWGSGGGGDVSGVAPAPSSIQKIYATEGAFAALSSTGRVYAWGTGGGGDSSAVAADLLADVVKVASTRGAFAALKSDGSLIVWGSATYGGDATTIAAELYNIQDIVGSWEYFVALRDDGQAIIWGDEPGNTPALSAMDNIISIARSQYDVFLTREDGEGIHVGGWGSFDATALPQDQFVSVQGYTSYHNFFALTANGGFYSFGSTNWGGDYNQSTLISPDVLEDVQLRTGSKVTLMKDGTVLATGEADAGGDISGVSGLDGTVIDIAGVGDGWDGAMAALKSDGKVVTWGNASFGGDSSAVTASLVDIVRMETQGSAFIFYKANDEALMWFQSTLTSAASVQQVYFNGSAFAILHKDKTVTASGAAAKGGDTTAVAASLVNVKKVFAGVDAFVAVTEAGDVICWGDASFGGSCPALSGVSGVQDVRQTANSWSSAFAALKADGTVVTWGQDFLGGDSSGVSGSLVGITRLASNKCAFLAVKGTDDVVLWGDVNCGGDFVDSNNWIDSIKAIHTIDRGFLVLTDSNAAVIFGTERIEKRKVENVKSVVSSTNTFLLTVEETPAGLTEPVEQLYSFGEWTWLLPQQSRYLLKGAHIVPKEDRFFLVYPDGSGRAL